MTPRKKPVPKKPAAKRGKKGDDPAYRPRMTDPVSGAKMQKGHPVPAAFSKDTQPDTGPMSRAATRNVPTPATLGRGILSGVNVGPSTYAPDPNRPYLQRFTNTGENRAANAVGRMVDPRKVGQIGGPDPKLDALRRGFPVQAEYDKGLGGKIRMGADQLDAALRGGKGDPNGKKPLAKKSAPKKKAPPKRKMGKGG